MRCIRTVAAAALLTAGLSSAGPQHVAARARGAHSLQDASGPPLPAVPPLPVSRRRFEEVRRFHAPEARQGVAVSATHFYAVGNAHLVQYARKTGERLREWKGTAGGDLVHLNSCTVLGPDLVCAHSNYPAVPMVSSIETWDAGTLEHRGSHSFGIQEGSLTWVLPRDGEWWLHFAHYGGRGGVPGNGPEWSTLVRFDRQWRRLAGYVYPEALVRYLAPYSASGGNWGPDGRLYVTGHDAPEIHVLRVPAMGSVLAWVETIPAPIHGQAWAFDPLDPGTVWGIQRASGEIVVARLRE